MSRDRANWRLFEKFVADLERLVDRQPGALIKCPDHIVDIDGVEREIDCSLSFKRGAITYLVIFECRDRKGGSDVQWVEQVAAKKEAVRADRAVMVHRKHLSKNALKKARRYGIDFRHLKAANFAGRPVGSIEYSFQRSGFHVTSVRLEMPNNAANLEVAAFLSKNPQMMAQERVIWDPVKEEYVSANELVAAMGEQAGIPEQFGEEISQHIVSVESTSDRQFHILTHGARAEVSKFHFKVTVLRAKVTLEQESSAEYFVGNQPPLQVDQFVVRGVPGTVTAAGLYEEKPSSEPGKVHVDYTFYIDDREALANEAFASLWQKYQRERMAGRDR